MTSGRPSRAARCLRAAQCRVLAVAALVVGSSEEAAETAAHLAAVEEVAVNRAAVGADTAFLEVVDRVVAATAVAKALATEVDGVEDAAATRAVEKAAEGPMEVGEGQMAHFHACSVGCPGAALPMGPV